MRTCIPTARRALGYLLGAALVVTLFASDGRAKGEEFFPQAKVRVGMKGYALTVFRGTTPERFEVEILGVMKNSLPMQDLWLFKSDDAKVAVIGIAGGMSGSPIYLDGKVACAISYAYRFNKETIGACTPIAYMLADNARKLRGPDQTAVASRDESRSHEKAEPWLLRPPVAAAPVSRDGGLARAAVPVALTGFSPRAFAAVKDLFAPYSLEPMEGAGGAGRPGEGPNRYIPGGNVVYQLATGDAAMSVLCTVTTVVDNRALGCGHPVFGMGEMYVPSATGEVHVIIPSVNNSFKMASPTRPLGSAILDVQSSVITDTTKETALIPVEIRIKGPQGPKSFSSQVLAHRFLTSQLISLMIGNATTVYAPDLSAATMKVKTSMKLRGHEPLVFTDYLFAADGMSPAVVSSLRGVRALVPLLFNPFEPVRIERFEVDAELVYKTEVAVIESIRIPQVELPAGKEIDVEVVMRPYAGPAYVKHLPITIPERLAGSVLKLEIVSGDQARPDVAPPETLAQLIAGLRKSYPGTQLVATLYLPDEGVSLEGRTLPDLPSSALDTIRPGTSSRKVEPYRSVSRFVAPLAQVAQGKQELTIRVAENP